MKYFVFQSVLYVEPIDEWDSIYQVLVINLHLVDRIRIQKIRQAYIRSVGGNQKIIRLMEGCLITSFLCHDCS